MRQLSLKDLEAVVGGKGGGGKGGSGKSGGNSGGSGGGGGSGTTGSGKATICKDVSDTHKICVTVEVKEK